MIDKDIYKITRGPYTDVTCKNTTLLQIVLFLGLFIHMPSVLFLMRAILDVSSAMHSDGTTITKQMMVNCLVTNKHTLLTGKCLLIYSIPLGDPPEQIFGLCYF